MNEADPSSSVSSKLSLIFPFLGNQELSSEAAMTSCNCDGGAGVQASGELRHVQVSIPCV